MGADNTATVSNDSGVKPFYGRFKGHFQYGSGAQRTFHQIHWLREALKVAVA